MSALTRRFGSGLLAMAGLASVTLCVAFANILGVRFDRRFDVTATGEHRLSPRSENLLSGLTHPYRIVVAGDLGATDPRARERVRDVLGELSRRTSKVTVREIDSGTPAGQASLDELIDELSSEYKSQTDAQVGAVDGAIRAAVQLAEYFAKSLAPSLEAVRDSLVRLGGQEKLAQGFADLAAATRNSAADLGRAAEQARLPLDEKLRGRSAPATDLAAATLREGMGPTLDQLGVMIRNLKRAAEGEGFPVAVRDTVTQIANAAEVRRGPAAAALDALSRMGRNDLRRVADVLSRTDAVLVIGPEKVGMSAIEFANLFPPTDWIAASGAARADLGRRAEELLASAIAGLESPVKPVVVLVHAEGRAFLDLQHRFNRVIERLALRGIDVCEWACAVDELPKKLVALNPDGSRPVVYVALAPNSAAGTSAAGEKSGVERARRLGEVLDALVRGGQSILLDLNPSVFPTLGQADPVAATLARFGLSADSGKPIVRERVDATGRAVVADAVARAGEGENPISRAVKGLPLYLEWPIAISREPQLPADVKVDTLFEIRNDGAAWAESQWSQMWYARARPELLPEQPTFDQRDAKADSWVVAVAAEIGHGPGDSQRLVAVGGNTWFIDERAQAARIDGRVVEGNPGNFELFEAAVYWLAAQDETIAQSPAARAVALIQAIPDGRVRLIRLLVIAGIPAGVLALGLLYRTVKG